MYLLWQQREGQKKASVTDGIEKFGVYFSSSWLFGVGSREMSQQVVADEENSCSGKKKSVYPKKNCSNSYVIMPR